jgi:hypothetical protein
LPEKAPAWYERSNAQVLQAAEKQEARINWRKVTITSDPLNGDIVIEYAMPGNHAPDVKRYSQSEYIEKARTIARTIGIHVTP